MAAFSTGDRVAFSLGGELFYGVVKSVNGDEVRVVDEDDWLVRVLPDVHFLCRVSDMPKQPDLDIPEEFL